VEERLAQLVDADVRSTDLVHGGGAVVGPQALGDRLEGGLDVVGQGLGIHGGADNQVALDGHRGGRSADQAEGHARAAFQSASAFRYRSTVSAVTVARASIWLTREECTFIWIAISKTL